MKPSLSAPVFTQLLVVHCCLQEVVTHGGATVHVTAFCLCYISWLGDDFVFKKSYLIDLNFLFLCQENVTSRILAHTFMILQKLQYVRSKFELCCFQLPYKCCYAGLYILLTGSLSLGD